MSNAKLDNNRIPTLIAVNTTDPNVILPITGDSNRMYISDGTSAPNFPHQLVSSSTGAGSVFGLDNTITSTAQSFMGTGDTIYSVKFVGRKVGSPTGNAYAKIYAHTGTFGTSSKPTGAALATSDPVDVSTFHTVFNTITPEFVFSGGDQITLTAGTPYVVAIEYAAVSNLVTIRPELDTVPGSAPGNMSYYFGGAWSPIASWNLAYYIYSTTIIYPNERIKDENRKNTFMALSSVDGVTPVEVYCDDTGHLLINSN